MQDAGFSIVEIANLKQEVKFYADIVNSIKLHACEALDTKPYEQDMRHLLNTYVDAEAAEKIGGIDGKSLYELIIATGINDAIAQSFNQKLKPQTIADGIINNIGQTLVSMHKLDPAYYAKISESLENLIKQQRENAEEYQQFLANLEQLIKKIHKPTPAKTCPEILHNKPEAITIYNNLASIEYDNFKFPEDEQAKAELAVAIDNTILENKQHAWLGDQTKERVIKQKLNEILKDATAVEALFAIIKNQPRYIE